MFKISASSVDTGRQTTPPLVDGVVHNRLVQFAPHVRGAHKSGYVINFIVVACIIFSRLKRYKNYKNRLRLTKVIVKNKMSRFYGSMCTMLYAWDAFSQIYSIYMSCYYLWRMNSRFCHQYCILV